jgi:hypothetical protein
MISATARTWRRSPRTRSGSQQNHSASALIRGRSPSRDDGRRRYGGGRMTSPLWPSRARARCSAVRSSYRGLEGRGGLVLGAGTQDPDQPVGGSPHVAAHGQVRADPGNVQASRAGGENPFTDAGRRPAVHEQVRAAAGRADQFGWPARRCSSAASRPRTGCGSPGPPAGPPGGTGAVTSWPARGPGKHRQSPSRPARGRATAGRPDAPPARHCESGGVPSPPARAQGRPPQ